jgi:ATP-dependent RNA helicase DDX5/DBP2
MFVSSSALNMLYSFQSRPASGLNLAQSALSNGQVSQAGNGNQMSPDAYRAKHEITIIVSI